MPNNSILNVQAFPRPPLLEKVSRHLLIQYHKRTIAETKDAFWVLETHHPPTYYLPRSAFAVPLTQTSHSSFCEWKGRATYWDVSLPGTLQPARNLAWSYETPTKGFEQIKSYISVYAHGPWECYVDGEKVQPQEGDFYGGWVTSDVDGKIKGGPGTLNW